VTEIGNGFVSAQIEQMNQLVAENQLARISPRGTAAVVTAPSGSRRMTATVGAPLSASRAMGAALAGWALGLLAALVVGKQRNTSAFAPGRARGKAT